jgi:hypothetical protein
MTQTLKLVTIMQAYKISLYEQKAKLKSTVVVKSYNISDDETVTYVTILPHVGDDNPNE